MPPVLKILLEGPKIMPLSIGIVGLPNVGKSTLFQALTKKPIDRSNYPFCTIDPNVGVVTVPDERVDKLAGLFKSKKKIYTTIEFVDIAGLVEGAHKGEGLGNQFLANIRETDAVLYLLRIFQNDKIINTRNKIAPLEDKGILETELALKDLATLEKRFDSLQKDVRGMKKGAAEELAAVERAKNVIEKGQILTGNISADDQEILKQYQLLTLKPRLYLLNGGVSELSAEIKEEFEKNNWPYLVIDILEEFGASELSAEEKAELGVGGQSKLDLLINHAYRLL